MNARSERTEADRVTTTQVHETWREAVIDAERLVARLERTIATHGANQQHTPIYLERLRRFDYCNSARERLIAQRVRDEVRQQRGEI